MKTDATTIHRYCIFLQHCTETSLNALAERLGTTKSVLYSITSGKAHVSICEQYDFSKRAKRPVRPSKEKVKRVSKSAVKHPVQEGKVIQVTVQGRLYTVKGAAKKFGVSEQLVRSRVAEFGTKLRVSVLKPRPSYKAKPTTSYQRTKLARIPGPTAWERENM